MLLLMYELNSFARNLWTVSAFFLLLLLVLLLQKRHSLPLFLFAERDNPAIRSCGALGFGFDSSLVFFVLLLLLSGVFILLHSPLFPSPPPRALSLPLLLPLGLRFAGAPAGYLGGGVLVLAWRLWTGAVLFAEGRVKRLAAGAGPHGFLTLRRCAHNPEAVVSTAVSLCYIYIYINISL